MNTNIQAICLGRAGLDLYAHEPNTAFKDVTGFHKHVGGSPANIAMGLARLGVRTGFIGRLSDDVVGHYVQDALQNEGIDISGIVFDSTGTRTSLAITEMRAENCAVVIYRNQAADLALEIADVQSDYVAAADLLLVSGTALTSNPSRGAVQFAMQAARSSGTRIVLDLDYRAYTWASLDEARTVYQAAAVLADVVIGNREEIDLLSETSDAAANNAGTSDMDIVSYLHSKGVSLVCIKAGEAGSTAYPIDGDVITQSAFQVDVVKPFGAGDAYAAALCAGFLSDQPLAVSLQRAAASAAMVVASTSCGDASPSMKEVDSFIVQYYLP